MENFTWFLQQNKYKKKMENQNIQYRKLRDPKRGKVGKFSASLLAKSSKLNKSTIQKASDQFDCIMKRNVIQYEHLLKNPLLHLNSVDWVSRLRQPITSKEPKSEQRQTVGAPSVFGKSTETMMNRMKQQKSKQIFFNTADYQQMLSRKGLNNHLPSGVLKFVTGLRDYPQSAKVLSSSKVEENVEQVSKQRKVFSTIPFKQRNNYPKFIKKQSKAKLKGLVESNLETAFDGHQNYPIYSAKIVRQKNYGVLCTFTTGKQKSSLPALAWQMGLRS